MAERTGPGTDESPSGGATEKVKEGAQQAQEKASEMAAGAREKASDAAGEAKKQTRHLADEGREKAEELAHKAEQRAISRAEEEKTRLATGIRTVADSLRQGAQDLPEDRQSYGRFVDTVADRAEGMSRYLENHEVDDMARQAQRFAREHTAVMLSGAFALGMAGARFLKSSSRKANRGGDYDRESGYPMNTGYPSGSGYRRDPGYGGTDRGDSGRYSAERYGQDDAGVDPMEEPLIYGPGEGTEAQGDSGAYSQGELRTRGAENDRTRTGGADA